MRRKLAGVNINDNQNNAFQPDITYCGFNVSPLLGTPIGLSVYQDGIRVNEAFGDTVNWDLIPKSAVANIDLIPGSNSLFGLNTLGGALSVRTKSGFSHSGTRAQAYGRSFGRKAFEAEHGSYKDNFDWFFAGNIFEDDGWRSFSHSAVHQTFGKTGWENDNTDLDLIFTFADNKLNGAGPAPESYLSQDRCSIYTAPDTLENPLYFFNLKGEHRFDEHLTVAGNAYYRGNTTNSVNSNTGNAEETCETLISLSECDDGTGNTVAPASNIANRIVQDGAGVNLQLTSTHSIFDHENQYTMGGGYNASQPHFTQSAQDAIFNRTRATIRIEPFTTEVNINGENEYISAFATDTFSVFPWLLINASARYSEPKFLSRRHT